MKKRNKQLLKKVSIAMIKFTLLAMIKFTLLVMGKISKLFYDAVVYLVIKLVNKIKKTKKQRNLVKQPQYNKPAVYDEFKAMNDIK